MRTIGRRSLPIEPRRFGSVTTRDARPVSSSICSMHRDAVDEVEEAHEAGDFRHDRVGMRIPGRDGLAGLDRRAVLDDDHRAVRQLVALALAAVVVEHRQFARTRHRDQVAVGVRARA